MKISKLVKSEDRPMITLSVRTLVEFLLRTGDIDDRHGSVDPYAAMQAGSRIHKKLQKSAGSTYHAEVGLKKVIEFEEYDLGIEGRADGIIYDLDEALRPIDVCIDEIKGVYADVEKMQEPIEVHLAQALCYAYIFAYDNSLDVIDVQITYVSLETELINRFKKKYTYEELENWFWELIEKEKKWSDYQYYHRLERNDSIKELKFPFDYRPGQKELVSNIYRSIASSNLLFVQAPTGTGKTIAAIFPAIHAIGQGIGDRVFYLTAKTATVSVAKDSFNLLNKQGYKGNSCIITAKDKSCLLEERACNPISCEYAKGHFDRVNNAVYDIITNEVLVTRDVIEDYAKKYQVCPFELSLDVTLWMDHIICDYNYVFDPNVYLKRFFAEGRNGNNIFLVDEAHNLVDRAREMYSVDLIKEEFLAVKAIMKNFSKKVTGDLEKCNKLLLEYKRQTVGEYLILEHCDRLIMATENLRMDIEALMAKAVNFGDHQEEVLNLYFRIRNFTDLISFYDTKHYRLYCEFDDVGSFVFHLCCIDPASQLQLRLDRAVATVYFSATLLPINYYKRLLSEEQEPFAIYVDSVFDKKNRLICVGSDVTSKYTKRGQDQYQLFAEYICNIVKARPGNYMVFGPSYKFINNVAEFCNYLEDKFSIIIQEPNMRESQREEFLESFSHDDNILAFCTMGGIFSEGIDLTGDRLIGAIIMGTGLPQVCSIRKIYQQFFDDLGLNGFEYAYLYPGMNKVIQAAGRVIRTVDDMGVIALLDERFCQSSYKKTFPREWDDCCICTKESISSIVNKFWTDIL